jgi:hypothetical protein
MTTSIPNRHHAYYALVSLFALVIIYPLFLWNMDALEVSNGRTYTIQLIGNIFISLIYAVPIVYLNKVLSGANQYLGYVFVFFLFLANIFGGLVDVEDDFLIVMLLELAYIEFGIYLMLGMKRRRFIKSLWLLSMSYIMLGLSGLLSLFLDSFNVLTAIVDFCAICYLFLLVRGT